MNKAFPQIFTCLGCFLFSVLCIHLWTILSSPFHYPCLSCSYFPSYKDSVWERNTWTILIACPRETAIWEGSWFAVRSIRNAVLRLSFLMLWTSVDTDTLHTLGWNGRACDLSAGGKLVSHDSISDMYLEDITNVRAMWNNLSLLFGPNQNSIENRAS